MSSSNPAELGARQVIELIASGTYPHDVVATIARGFLPLEQKDLIAVLAYLAESGDPEISALANASLTETPARAILDFASNESSEAEHLARLMRVTRDEFVLEALVRNPRVEDAAVADLARRAEGRLQEVIVINQFRILRTPEILDALLENATLTADVRRRALETREEFFVKKARLQEELADVLEPDLINEPLDAIADLLQKAVEEGDVVQPQTVPPLNELEKKDEKQGALWTRLQLMTVSEKVQLAFKGDRMVRLLLVRERNKLICSAVMRNPRMSEQEAEAIAGMRNVEEEVLRLIGRRRDWMSKYNVMIALLRNPKAPLGVVLPFVSRLTLRDLKGLKEDKGVQQVIREMAKKMYTAKVLKS